MLLRLALNSRAQGILLAQPGTIAVYHHTRLKITTIKLNRSMNAERSVRIICELPDRGGLSSLLQQ